MRPIARDGVAWSVCVSVCLSVCLLVGHVHRLCKNYWTYRDADWRVDSGGPNEPCVWCGRDPPRVRGNFRGFVSQCCGVRSKETITATARLLQPTALLPTGLCHINFSRRCGLSSKFFDNLLKWLTWSPVIAALYGKYFGAGLWLWYTFVAANGRRKTVKWRHRTGHIRHVTSIILPASPSSSARTCRYVRSAYSAPQQTSFIK